MDYKLILDNTTGELIITTPERQKELNDERRANKIDLLKDILVAETPLVSVIVPCYNQQEVVQQTIQSIVNQTYKNLQIICIDDGSADQTLERINQLAQTDKRIIVLSKTNGGVSSARNYGLRQATGEYVTFVDGDDQLSLDYIGTLARALTDNYTDAVFSGVKNIGLNGETVICAPAEKELILTTSADGIIALLKKSNCFGVLGKMFKRSKLTSMFNEKLTTAEDYEFNLKNIIALNKVLVLPYAGYIYIRRLGSITMSGRQTAVTDYLKALSELSVVLDSPKCTSRLAYMLCRRIYKAFAYQIMAELENGKTEDAVAEDISALMKLNDMQKINNLFCGESELEQQFFPYFKNIDAMGLVRAVKNGELVFGEFR